MIEYPRDLGEQHPDILRPERHLAAQQLFDCEAVAMLLAHHRDVIEAIEIGQRLKIGLMLDELFRPAMQPLRNSAMSVFEPRMQDETKPSGRPILIFGRMTGSGMPGCFPLTQSITG